MLDARFCDRTLTCADCTHEFIFTAGEQLFFADKQFKNDPKRCKPCKSRRSGLSAVAAGLNGGVAAAGISRTETRTDCSACGIETTVPFKPTQGRPVLCRQCFQAKAPVARPRVASKAEPLTLESPASLTQASLTPAQTVSALTRLCGTAGDALTAEAAVLAAASMASASAGSNVATASDLASITQLPREAAQGNELDQPPAAFLPVQAGVEAVALHAPEGYPEGYDA